MVMSYWNQMQSDRKSAPFREGSPEWDHRTQQTSYGAQQREYQAKQDKARDAKDKGSLLWMLDNDNMRAHWDAKYAQKPEKPRGGSSVSWTIEPGSAPNVSPLRQEVRELSAELRQPLANVSAGTPLPKHGEPVKAGPSKKSSDAYLLPWQSKPFMESTGLRGSSVHTGESWRGGASIPSGLPPALEQPGQARQSQDAVDPIQSWASGGAPQPRQSAQGGQGGQSNDLANEMMKAIPGILEHMPEDGSDAATLFQNLIQTGSKAGLFPKGASPRDNLMSLANEMELLEVFASPREKDRYKEARRVLLAQARDMGGGGEMLAAKDEAGQVHYGNQGARDQMGWIYPSTPEPVQDSAPAPAGGAVGASPGIATPRPAEGPSQFSRDWNAASDWFGDTFRLNEVEENIRKIPGNVMDYFSHDETRQPTVQQPAHQTAHQTANADNAAPSIRNAIQTQFKMSPGESAKLYNHLVKTLNVRPEEITVENLPRLMQQYQQKMRSVR